MNRERVVKMNPQIVEQFEHSQESMLVKGGEQLGLLQSSFINIFNCKCRKNNNDNGCAACARTKRRRNRKKKRNATA